MPQIQREHDQHLFGHAGRSASAATFAQTLIEHDQMDEYRLMIDPLVVGGGKRLFRSGAALKPLRLVESKTTSTGAILPGIRQPRSGVKRTSDVHVLIVGVGARGGVYQRGREVRG
jgi:RibD C-terminal domain